MSRKHYTIAIVMVVGMVLISGDLLAQRGRYPRGYRGYYPRYVPARSFMMNRPFVSIQFGGSHYRYQHGFFYRPYGSVFSVVVPPVGIRIATLPPGYRRVYAGPDPYYYYNGTYYRPGTDRQYEVVAPPLGAEIDRLPPGAKVTVINGQKYYELAGTFYEEMISSENELYYKVVGTDGVLNTTSGGNENWDDSMDEDDDSNSRLPAGPRMGDRFETLPPDAKEVVINGEKYYTTHSGFYYKEVIEGRKVLYEVVGK